MDAGAYPSAHSFDNDFPAHEPAIGSLSFYRRIQCLSIFLTPEEIVELSHQLQGCRDSDLHRLATSLRRQSLSLSESQRSSYLSNFSRQSILSSSSIYSRDSAPADSRAIEPPTLESEHEWADPYSTSQPGTQDASLFNSFRPTRQGLQNQESPYPTYATPTQRPFCFACNVHFKNNGSLSRHQKEQCKREKIAACSLCPPPQPMYYTKERLLRHHVTSHGDKCNNGCSKKENKISVPCKEHLSESFEKLPPKKAWGCPYCVSCFKSFEEWNDHCVNHLKKADKAPSWCFGTMIWSLLQQDSLKDARMRHDFPNTSHWTTINEKTCSGLREILEHCKIPNMLRTHEHWYISEADAVVRYVYDLIIKGHTPPNQQLFEAKIKLLPNQMPTGASESRKDVANPPESFPAHGDPNKVIRAFLQSHDRTDNAYITQNTVRKRAGSESQPHSTAAMDTAVAARARPPEISDVDHTATTQTRKRAPSLKRSLSNLALRPSASRPPAIQTVAAPPVPPLPGDTKVLSAEKPGTAAHQGLGWPASTYLDPIPHHRPMSGVEYNDWSWPDGSQNQ